MQLGRGARTEPNVRATTQELYAGLVASSQNRWPSLRFDIGAINDIASRLVPAGFYYKTFMWPKRFWMRYEHLIRHAAGMGRAATSGSDAYEHQYGHCDVLVIGAGPRASPPLGRRDAGARVLLCDENPVFGGGLVGAVATIDGLDAVSWLAGIAERARGVPEVTLLSRTTAFGYYDGSLVGCSSALPITSPSRRNGRLASDCGRFVRNPSCSRPARTSAASPTRTTTSGNAAGGAARTYVERFAVRPDRAVVVTNNDSVCDGTGVAVRSRRRGDRRFAVGRGASKARCRWRTGR